MRRRDDYKLGYTCKELIHSVNLLNFTQKCNLALAKAHKNTTRTSSYKTRKYNDKLIRHNYSQSKAFNENQVIDPNLNYTNGEKINAFKRVPSNI